LNAQITERTGILTQGASVPVLNEILIISFDIFAVWDTILCIEDFASLAKV
jgi:hypothetical protein